MEFKEKGQPLFNRLMPAAVLVGSLILTGCGSKNESIKNESIRISPGLNAHLKAGHDIVFMHSDMVRYIHEHDRTVLTITVKNRLGTQQIKLANGQSISSANAYADNAGDLALDCLPIPPDNTCDLNIERTQVTAAEKPIKTIRSEVHVRPADEFLRPAGTNA